MIKKLGKLLVVCLIVIGGYNVVTLNKPVFSKIGNTLTKKSISEIPGELVSDISSHSWKFAGK